MPHWNPPLALEAWGVPLVPCGPLLGAGYFGGRAPAASSMAWASSRCPADEGWMLQVPSGSLISSPAAHGEPPKAADGPWKAAKPSATFPPKASVTDAITESSRRVPATWTGLL